MTEYERIRKEIGKTLVLPCNESDWKACNNPKKWEEGYCMEKDCRDCITGQILSLDGIEIRAENQDLPELNLPTLSGNRSLEVTITSFAKHIRGNMLKPDSEGKHWVKVAPKPYDSSKVIPKGR